MGGSFPSLPRQPRRVLQKAQWFHFYDLDGQQRSLDLDPARWRYYLPGARGGASVRTTEDRDHRADGSRYSVEALNLDAETSAAVFERTGAVRRLDVFFDFEGGG